MVRRTIVNKILFMPLCLTCYSISHGWGPKMIQERMVSCATCFEHRSVCPPRKIRDRALLYFISLPQNVSKARNLSKTIFDQSRELCVRFLWCKAICEFCQELKFPGKKFKASATGFASNFTWYKVKVHFFETSISKSQNVLLLPTLQTVQTIKQV